MFHHLGNFFLLLLVVGGVTDLVLDRPSTWFSVHVLFEAAFVLVSAVFATLLWLGWRRTTERLFATQTALMVRDAERDAWRANAQKALEGMARAIDSQFSAWSLLRPSARSRWRCSRGLATRRSPRAPIGANAPSASTP